jgi:hypothetical protein
VPPNFQAMCVVGMRQTGLDIFQLMQHSQCNMERDLDGESSLSPRDRETMGSDVGVTMT